MEVEGARKRLRKPKLLAPLLLLNGGDGMAMPPRSPPGGNPPLFGKWFANPHNHPRRRNHASIDSAIVSITSRHSGYPHQTRSSGIQSKFMP